MTLLACQSLKLSRPGGLSFSFPDIDLAPRDKCLLSGASGSGKSTLLSIIAGLLKPDSGSVVFLGQNIYVLPAPARDSLRGRSIGFIFQSFHLLPALSIADNLVIAARLGGTALDRRGAAEALEHFGLAHRAHARPDSLSQGEQQRAAIARAVLNKPSLLIADEPTSALDDSNAALVMDLLEGEAEKSGSALLVASHDSRLFSRFDKRVVLSSASGMVAA
jgi:putative ABC transport system ATP-binding protein